MVSNYYVYGGGRWRSLDARNGRVSGWSGARLCVARRGRLEVRRGAARRRLLAALRALAAGRPSAARLGPCLARNPPDEPARSRSHCRCCCHHNNSGCKSPAPAPTAARPLTSDACIQTASPAPPPPRPRLAFSSSTTTVTTAATVHNTPSARNTSTPVKKQNTATSPSKRQNSSTSWKHDESSSDSAEKSSSESIEPPVNNTKTSPTKKAKLSLKRKYPQSDSDSSDTSKSEISLSQSILKKDFNAKFLRPQKSVRRDSPSRASPSRDRQPRIRTRVIPGQVIHSSDDETKDPTVDYRSLKHTQDTETEEEKTQRNKSIDLFMQKSQKFHEKKDTYRELVIPDDDVDILRSFMIKNKPGFDLYRYDHDDTYKARFFYSINPLVTIERCPRIFSKLEGQEERLSLQQFASQLGLRSVSDGVSSRASPRKRRRRANVVYSQDDSDSEDKENLETAIRRSLRHNTSKHRDKGHKPDREGRRTVEDTHHHGDREKANNVSEMTEVTVNIERLKDDGQRRANKVSKQRNSQRDNLKRKYNVSGDDKELNEDGRKQQRKLQEHQDTNTEDNQHTNKQVRNKNDVKTSDFPNDLVKKKAYGPVIPIKDNLGSKEYSSLEDHAIVEWISKEDRASLVNGNRVWRSLEEVFEEVGGRARSWHSLRNRYLRYLLPTLGRLELPAALQARLRAAAARGEIKGRKTQRRNSIYEETVRGAASRRPGLPASPSPVAVRASDSRAPRTPRYSEVTRQFAARHAPSSSSEFEAPKSPRLHPRSPESRGPNTRTSGPRSRTRKLYNPNKL